MERKFKKNRTNIECNKNKFKFFIRNKKTNLKNSQKTSNIKQNVPKNKQISNIKQYVTKN